MEVQVWNAHGGKVSLKIPMDYIAFLVAAAATEKASYTAFVPGGVNSMILAMIMVSPLLTARKCGER